jgi:hypothetical protein
MADDGDEIVVYYSLYRAASEKEAEWRELVKPLVLEMHRQRLWRIELKKIGGKVELLAWPEARGGG